MQVLNPTHTPLDPRVIAVGAVGLPSHWTDEFKTFVRQNLVASEIVPLLRAELEQLKDPKHVPFFVEQALRRYVERILDGNPNYPVLPDVLYRVDKVEVEGGSVGRYVEAELLDLSCYRLSEEAESVEWPYHWTLMYRQFVFDNLEPEAVKELFSVEVSARESAGLESVHELSVEDESRIASDAMDAYAATAGLPKFEGKFIHDPAPTELEAPSSESHSEAAMTTTPDPTRLPSHWMPAFQEFVRTKLNEAQALYLIRFEQELRIDAPNAGPFAIARKLRHETVNIMRENGFSDEEIKLLTWEVIATDPSVQVEIIDLGPSTAEVEANLEAVETADATEEVVAGEAMEQLEADSATDIPAATEDLLSTITPTTHEGFPGHWTLRYTSFLLDNAFTAEDIQYLTTIERQLRSGDLDFHDDNEDAPLLDRVEAYLIKETKGLIEDGSSVPTALFDRTVPFDDQGVLMAHTEDAVEDESDMSADAGTPIDAFPFTPPNAEEVQAHYESQVTVEYSCECGRTTGKYNEGVRCQHCNTLVISYKPDTGPEELPAPPAEVTIDMDTLVETTTEAGQEGLMYPQEWSDEFTLMMDRLYDQHLVEEAIRLQTMLASSSSLQSLASDGDVDFQRVVEYRIIHMLAGKTAAAVGNNVVDLSAVRIETMDELRTAPVAEADAHIDDTEISNSLGGYHLEIAEGPLPELNGKFPLRVRRSGYPVVFLYGTEAFRDTAWHDVQEARKREEQQAKVAGYDIPLSDIPRSTMPFDPAMVGHTAEDREAAAAASLRRAGERVTRHAAAQAERKLDPNHTVEMTLDASETDKAKAIRFINLSEVLRDLVTVLATRQLPERFDGDLLSYVQYMHVTLIDLMQALRAVGFDETDPNYDTAMGLVEQIKTILDDLTVL